MRLWSLHPKYLDTKGLVALWRETLLAKHVLEGRTKGYRNHPQLDRFKQAEAPIDSINQYLSVVYQEAATRSYNFDKNKIEWNFKPGRLTVTSGQLNYEIAHLLNKLKIRDTDRYHLLSGETLFDPHPLFHIVEGDIEDWEILEDMARKGGSKKP